MLLISGIVNIIGDKKMQDKTKKPDKWAFYIQNILEQNKVSQAGFARMCGVSRACVNLWVSNNRRPKIDQLKNIIGAVARVTGKTRGEATKEVCANYLYGIQNVD